MATTTTGAGGLYSFSVVPGTYRVDFELPGGYSFSPRDQGGNDALDSDAWYNLGLDLEEIDPERAPEAYERAIELNGVQVADNGVHTGARPGRALRRGM